MSEATKAPETVKAVLKAAVGAGSLSDPAFAGALDDHAEIVGAFVEALRSRSIFARLLDDGMIRLPLRTRASIIVANATGYAVGEGLPVPISAMSLAGPQLEERRAAAMVVLTSELLRSTSSAGRALLDASLKGAVADAIDAAFLGILADDITPATASGPTAADALVDLKTMLDGVNSTGSGILLWAMSTDVANAASVLSGPGGLVFPAMSGTGGELVNLPAAVTNALPAGTLMLIDASGIAGELETITIAMADQASVQMSTTPDAPPNAAGVLTSLWQSNLVALLARAFFGAEVIRTGSVAILGEIDWGATP
ncbi:MAG: phage major capsid protein [Bosea sp.]|uniref:phage major capsid family protein n=1 Tax=Bosea sp. (in: a-proteobacteria) TaxID=1871050 RepID=UPI0031FF0944|nr:phage major capsid protein [Bosea sp. (in: a-proteobacteria)]